MPSGVIYVLTNASFTSLVKIGKTTRTAKERAAQLSTTGVPTRYVVAYEQTVMDCDLAEILIHKALLQYRHGKEFFTLQVDEAIPVITNIIQAVNELPHFRVEKQVVSDPPVADASPTRTHRTQEKVKKVQSTWGSSIGSSVYSFTVTCPYCQRFFEATVLPNEKMTFCPSCSAKVLVK